MADVKISALPAATVPLAGTEILPIVQSGATKQVSVQNVLSSAQPTGTANGVAYLNGSKVLTTGAALTFDGNNFSVTSSAPAFNSIVAAPANDGGIKITYASTQFASILGNANAGTLTYSMGPSTGWGGVHAWHIDTAEQMRLTSTGLGIGTSSPGEKLTVYNGTSRTLIRAASDLNFAGAYLGTATSTNRGASLELLTHANSSNSTGWRTAVSVDLFGGTADMVFSYAENSSTYAGLSYSEKMRLDAFGNLGLGVTPSAWTGGFKALQMPGGSVASYASGTNLQIEVGSAYYQSSLGGYAYFNTGTAPTIYRQFNGAHQWFNAPSGTAGNAITFTQAMTLDANGNRQIGTTSAVNSARDTIQFQSSSGGTGISLIDAQANNTACFASFYSNTTQIGSITNNNNSSVLYNTSSDYRLKNITGPITTSGAYIDSLKPVQGTWKADGSTFVGLIAHEVQEASRTPVATGTKDGAEMQGMDYSNSELIANMLAELQSLRARVAQLESKP